MIGRTPAAIWIAIAVGCSSPPTPPLLSVDPTADAAAADPARSAAVVSASAAEQAPPSVVVEPPAAGRDDLELPVLLRAGRERGFFEVPMLLDGDPPGPDQSCPGRSAYGHTAIREDGLAFVGCRYEWEKLEGARERERVVIARSTPGGLQPLATLIQWDADRDEDGTVHFTMRRLAAGRDHLCIETVRGIGRERADNTVRRIRSQRELHILIVEQDAVMVEATLAATCPRRGYRPFVPLATLPFDPR